MPTLETAGSFLSYLREGRGPPVLLLQGVGLIGEGWRPQIRGLADRYSLIAPDNRGIGKSTSRDGRLTIEDMAADARAIMDAEGCERFHVVGHSMGGVIAQALALAVPGRVASLSLLCTFARGRDGAAMSLPMVVAALRMRIGTRAMRRRAFLELIMPVRYLRTADLAALAEEMRPLFGHDLAEQPSIAFSQLRAMSKFDASPRLATLASIPTLVVSASDDRIAGPANGRAIAERIPGARYIEIPDAGHGVTIHRAGDINRLLAEHWAAAEARTAG